MNFINDFSAQELDTDAVFLEKARTMYRHSMVNILVLTDNFKNKKNLMFFIGKNKAEIFDGFIMAEKKAESYNSACAILEKICLSDDVEMAYKKHVILAYARFIHTKHKYVGSSDADMIDASYMMCVKYIVDKKEFGIFNQIQEVQENLIVRISKTSWANSAIVWAFEEASKLFLDMSPEQLSKPKKIKYGHTLSDTAQALMGLNKLAETKVLFPAETIVKNVLLQNNAVREYAMNNKSNGFFGTTETSTYTGSIKYDAILEMLMEINPEVVEDLFILTEEVVIDALGATRNGDGSKRFGWAIKSSIAKWMIGRGSKKIFAAVKDEFDAFKSFLMEAVPEVERITSKEGHEDEGDDYHRAVLSKYLGKDAHRSCSPKYTTAMQVFSAFATIKDVADVMGKLSTMREESYRMGYFWNKSTRQIVNVSVMAPKQLLQCNSVEGNESELIEELKKTGASNTLCGEIFTYAVKQLYKKFQISDFIAKNQRYEQSAGIIREMNELFGKYRANLKAFGVSRNIIEDRSMVAVMELEAKNIMEFVKEGEGSFCSPNSVIFAMFPHHGEYGERTIKNEFINSADMLKRFINEGLTTMGEIKDAVSIVAGADYGLLELEDVKAKLIKATSMSELAKVLGFFTMALNDKPEITYSKQAIEFMLGNEISTYIDTKLGVDDIGGLKMWRVAVEKTLLSSGRLLGVSVNKDKKEEKLQEMFLKHFGLKL